MRGKNLQGMKIFNKINRKDFLEKSLKICGLSTLGGIVFGQMASSGKAAPLALRPPGACDEDDFIRQCIKCGLCVEACPYNTLTLAKVGDLNPVGTPFFTPRHTPCYLCEDVPCTRACPTDALQEEKVGSLRQGKRKWEVNKARMGIAVIDPANCLAFGGIQCDACYRACPLIDRAITLKYEENTFTGHHASLIPEVQADFCTGCGLCEHACVTEKASVFVLPLKIAQGRQGNNYIKSWRANDEKRLQKIKTAKPENEQEQNQKTLDLLNQEVPVNE